MDHFPCCDLARAILTTYGPMPKYPHRCTVFITGLTVITDLEEDETSFAPNGLLGFDQRKKNAFWQKSSHSRLKLKTIWAHGRMKGYVVSGLWSLHRLFFPPGVLNCLKKCRGG